MAATASTPTLPEFLRWINDMPAAFLEEPRCGGTGKVPVHAVVADLFETYFDARPEDSLQFGVEPAGADAAERNRLRWVLAACHVMWHPGLRAQSFTKPVFRKLMIQEMSTLAAAVRFETLLGEQDRQEELVRRILKIAGLLLPGESKADADDRLTQIDSIERQRLIKEAAGKEARAKKVREEMLKKAAAEAAAKTSRE
jgi:hypothetical protein